MKNIDPEQVELWLLSLRGEREYYARKLSERGQLILRGVNDENTQWYRADLLFEIARSKEKIAELERLLGEVGAL